MIKRATYCLVLAHVRRWSERKREKRDRKDVTSNSSGPFDDAPVLFTAAPVPQKRAEGGSELS